MRRWLYTTYTTTTTTTTTTTFATYRTNIGSKFRDNRTQCENECRDFLHKMQLIVMEMEMVMFFIIVYVHT